MTATPPPPAAGASRGASGRLGPRETHVVPGSEIRTSRSISEDAAPGLRIPAEAPNSETPATDARGKVWLVGAGPLTAEADAVRVWLLDPATHALRLAAEPPAMLRPRGGRRA